MAGNFYDENQNQESFDFDNEDELDEDELDYDGSELDEAGGVKTDAYAAREKEDGVYERENNFEYDEDDLPRGATGASGHSRVVEPEPERIEPKLVKAPESDGIVDSGGTVRDGEKAPRAKKATRKKK